MLPSFMVGMKLLPSSGNKDKEPTNNTTAMVIVFFSAPKAKCKTVR